VVSGFWGDLSFRYAAPGRVIAGGRRLEVVERHPAPSRK